MDQRWMGLDLFLITHVGFLMYGNLNICSLWKKLADQQPNSHFLALEQNLRHLLRFLLVLYLGRLADFSGSLAEQELEIKIE